MIKANELRIGNIVLFCGDVYTVNLESFHLTKVPAFPYDPIPLTPEILEQAGFEKSGFYYYLNDVRLYEYHSDFKVNEGYIFDYGMTKSFSNIKYLHQLQNLYFDLTSEELQINFNVAIIN